MGAQAKILGDLEEFSKVFIRIFLLFLLTGFLVPFILISRKEEEIHSL